MTGLNLEKGELNIKLVASLVVGVVIFVVWFYNSVIIPIQQVQVSITQIQASLVNQSVVFKDLNTRVNVIENKLNIPR